MDDENTPHDETIADADLVLRTRSGDAQAFGELWRRHYPSGMAVARSVTSSIDPDDLVQESYTRIYQAIIKGGGPNGSFRAYLFTSIRNTAAAWGRSRKESAIDELDTVADPDSTEQASNEALDRSLTAQAFRSLPSRWQEVLWYTEIEQMKPNEVAPLLGMKAGAVSQLAFRAREGLREAWIQAHLRSTTEGSDCQWAIEHLGAYSRGNLSTRDHKRLEEHLDSCARCMIVAAEAKDVSTRLALVLLPLVLGIAGSTGYLATLQGGGTPLVALAAMPSSVVEGGVVVGGTAAGGIATGLTGSSAGGAGGGTGGTSSGAGAAGGAGGGAGASGGALSGIGALVGAGSAALVVAGVVAAATILPGLAGANPAASLPNAGAGDSSSITTDIAPDDSLSEDESTPADEIDDTDDEKTEPESPVEPTDPADEILPIDLKTDSVPVTVPSAAPRPPVSDPKPPVVDPDDASSDADGGNADADGGNADADADADGGNADADAGADGGNADADGGNANAGGGNANADGGNANAGGGNADADGGNADADGGNADADADGGNGGTDPETPSLPDTAPTISAATVWLDENFVTHYTVLVSGVPGMTVESLISGSTGGTGTTELVADVADPTIGYGTIDLRPSGWQILFNARVEFFYVLDGVRSPAATVRLSDLGQLSTPTAALTDAGAPAPASSTSDGAEPTTSEPTTSDPAPPSDAATEAVSDDPQPVAPPTEPVVPENPPAVEQAVPEEPVVEEPVPTEPETTQPETVEPAATASAFLEDQAAPLTDEARVEEPGTGTTPTEGPVGGE
ncbi:sigma-70 family RNA polymerase sigma factor [Microbacterium sp. ZW T5_45]|uniref:sigma-70 family RNA polymerase sigma factor n=1 Tax=Microbacterium sp. ZW T5_45 TaxID=3378080 RepID=UPI0038536463